MGTSAGIVIVSVSSGPLSCQSSHGWSTGIMSERFIYDEVLHRKPSKVRWHANYEKVSQWKKPSQAFANYYLSSL